MPVRIRLARGGAKKRPFYRIVVADSRRARDGKFIDQVGTYNPMLPKDSPERVKIDVEKTKDWIAKGAQPSDRVTLFLGARQFLRTPKNRALAWVNPRDIKVLVEDQTAYDPIVDYVQQSRAGRFVVPIYVPENQVPSFPLVSDHSNELRKSDASKDQSKEMSFPEKDTLLADESLEIAPAEKFEAVTDTEDLGQDDAITMTETSTYDHIKSAESFDEPTKEKIDEQNPLETKESNKSEPEKTGVSAASLLDGIEVEDDEGEDFDIDTGGLHGNIDDESDVVFGEGRIEKKSMTKFVSNYPDSTIKFLLRKNLDGRPLPTGYDEIYLNWENRGLSRGRLKKYLFKLMEWQDFPEIPVLDVVRKIRERHFELKEKNK